jgi:hypothetical protein
MLKASQFRLVTVQAVIFTPNLAEFSQARLLGSVLARYSQRYDGPVEAVTLPENAPPHQPRVTLKSRDEVWRLHASPARTDSVWVRPSASLLAPAQEELSDQERVLECAQVLVDLVQSNMVRVGRMALVLNRFSLVANPPQEMIAHFAHPELLRGAFRQSAGFEVHNLTRYPMPAGPMINSWSRCRSATIMPGPQPAVSFEQDLNTLEEEAPKRHYAADEIRDYFARAAEEAASILSVYFPEDDR